MQKRKKTYKSKKLKILVVVEFLAIFSLLILCVYKNTNIPILSDIFNTSQKKVDVVLDAGHGGYDTGGIYEDIYEKDITLAITKEIGTYVEGQGYRVGYTRDSDDVSWPSEEVADLSQRLEISQESGATLFVSIHTNDEETNNGSYGYEVWGKIKNDTVFELSKNILDQLDTLEYSQNRGMKDQDTSPLMVLEKNNIPAVLVETGFIGSEQDRSYMNDPRTQKKIANEIGKGIVKTLEGLK